MNGDADIASVAALMGEPTRAMVLVALADGRALAASTLAAEAGVAPSTLSGHLARLLEGGLVQVEPSGRNRYFRLSNPQVAETIEALARLASPRPVRSLRAGTHAEAIRRGRTCYDHLAGRLGVALLEGLLTEGILQVQSKPVSEVDPVLGAGRALRYQLTHGGRERLTDLGVDLQPSSRRPFVRYCVDWSEQRPHLAGALGAALLDQLIALRWVVRGERRVVRVTALGQGAITGELGVDAATFA